MSYNFDGKIANQCPKLTNYTSAKTHCSKCNKILEVPRVSGVSIGDRLFLVRDYLECSSFIYETKSGTAAVYCSEYCRDKHNHRFRK
jgi:hypothetical protein